MPLLVTHFEDLLYIFVGLLYVVCNQAVAEIVTTFLLVFVTCGAASLSTKDDHKVPQLGASVASWLIMTVLIYVGHFFGEHMNLAVTLAVGSEGLWLAVRIWKESNALIYVDFGDCVGLQDCIVRYIASASLGIDESNALIYVDFGDCVGLQVSLTMPDQRNGSVNYFILTHRSWEGKHAHCIPLALCLIFVLHYEKRSATNN
ncbi:aquaporin NIP2-1-like protein [Tanacetum coccineum]